MVNSWGGFKEGQKRQEGVMEKRYRVTLTETERVDLQKLVRVDKSAAQKLVRARMVRRTLKKTNLSLG